MPSLNLIDALRGDEIASLTADVRAGRRDHALKSLDERGAAQDLIRQQYSGRYPFELLQNANDAAAEAGRDGRVRFILTESSLLVADNGTGFWPEQVRAICGLARSSKDPRKSVGYKGLGFKSVGEITDRPQISSTEVRFEFDEARVFAEVRQVAGELPQRQRLPVYAFPFALDLNAMGSDGERVRSLHNQGFTTVLRLPFKAGIDQSDVSSHLANNLVPRLLLFLRSMAELELEGSPADFGSSVARSDDGDCEEVLLQHDSSIEHWLVYRREVSVDPEIVAPLGDAWSVVERVHVAVAVPLDDDGRPDVSTTYPVHVYFPTEERTGLPVVVQGDFALQLDRRQVASSPETDPFNRLLLSAAADLVGHVASALAQRFPGDGHVASAMAQRSQASEHGEALVELCIAALRGARYLPGCDGEPRMPVEALLLPSAVTDPAQLHRYLDLRTMGRLLKPAVEADPATRSFLTKRLQVQAWAIEDAMKHLKQPTDDKVDEFYETLLSWSDALPGNRLASVLSSVPFVQTVEGRWAAPGVERVFFPRRREDVEVPDDLPVPIAMVPELPGLAGLLKECGVRDFEWRELLTNYILPLLTERATDADHRDRALNGLRAYFSSQRSGDPRLRRQIAEVLIPVRQAKGDEIELRPAGQTYFGSDWSGSNALEEIYGPFAEPEFLAMEPPDIEPSRRAEREFLAWLGVAAHPRVLEAEIDQRDMYLTENMARHPHRGQGGWLEWWASPQVVEARSCGQGHSSSQQLRRSYALDRFKELADSQDESRLRRLWHELAANWNTVYGRATASVFYCQHSWHGGERERQAPSLLRHLLVELPWIPAVKAKQVVLVAPPDAWRRALDTPRGVLKRVALVDEKMLDGAGSSLGFHLELTDAARPSPKDLVQLLTDMAEECEAAAGSIKEIQTAARWAMRTLNDSLTDTGCGDAEVPLLANYKGKSVFVAHPVVAVDPLLARAWEDHYPILDADKDLHRLHSALGLESLDAGVQVLPRPIDLRDDLRTQIEDGLRRAKPYLAAVAVDAAPSQEGNVLGRLNRLDVVVCSELILSYTFNGVTLDRTDATAYIAARQEQGRGFITRQFGTAHLEIDCVTGEPDWYGFGPQLAHFVGVQTVGDAFAMLLMGDDAHRRRLLASRHIDAALAESMRSQLELPLEELDEDGLLDELGDLLGPREGSGGPPDLRARGGWRSDDESGKPEVEAEELPLPEINGDLIQLEDADPGPAAMTRRSRSTNFGPVGPVDHDKDDRKNREVGRRGEMAAYEAEKRRVAAFGGDPSAVVWRADRNPFSPFDIESLDERGVRIYIEVKSTTGDDVSTPFLISQTELVEALRRRETYFIYRVTNTETAAPMVTRYCDPAGLLIDGRARLSLADARMVIGPSQSWPR